MSEVDDRRQRAREAHQDAWVDYEDRSVWNGARALDRAIEVATQVKITDDIYSAAWRGYNAHGSTIFRMEDVIEAAFRAAGFEVIE